VRVRSVPEVGMAGPGRARISPEWWREHRPILLATILPVLAAIGVFVAVTTMHTSPNLANRPSMALFSACLDANNLDPIGGYTTQFDATEAAQQAMKLCGNKLPASVRNGSAQQNPGVVAFNSCMKNLGGDRHSGGFFGRRFGGGSSFRNAYLTCRSLLAGNAPDQGGGASSTTTTTPVAPIA
jgi:hypothetical protein